MIFDQILVFCAKEIIRRSNEIIVRRARGRGGGKIEIRQRILTRSATTVSRSIRKSQFHQFKQKIKTSYTRQHNFRVSRTRTYRGDFNCPRKLYPQTRAFWIRKTKKKKPKLIPRVLQIQNFLVITATTRTFYLKKKSFFQRYSRTASVHHFRPWGGKHSRTKQHTYICRNSMIASMY